MHAPPGRARDGRLDRILARPPQAFTGDADNPRSIKIKDVTLRVAGTGGGAWA
jgi:hypothetical protein